MIKVTQYFKNHSKDGKESPLVATFNIVTVWPSYGEFYINGLKLFRKNGGLWIKFPDKEYLKDGEKKYFPHCGFLERPIHEKFQKEIIEAIHTYAKQQKQQLENPPKPTPASVIEDQEELPF